MVLDHHVSYSLNSLKGAYIGDDIREYYRLTKGETRSRDYSSHVRVPVHSRRPPFLRALGLQPCKGDLLSDICTLCTLYRKLETATWERKALET